MSFGLYYLGKEKGRNLSEFSVSSSSHLRAHSILELATFVPQFRLKLSFVKRVKVNTCIIIKKLCAYMQTLEAMQRGHFPPISQIRLYCAGVSSDR